MASAQAYLVDANILLRLSQRDDPMHQSIDTDLHELERRRMGLIMLAHGVTHLLTLNQADFARYANVVAVHPRQLQASPR